MTLTEIYAWGIVDPISIHEEQTAICDQEIPAKGQE
jgi:hypothetical protein